MTLLLLISCTPSAPEPADQEPLCFLVLFANECASSVGRCDECADDDERWFECADGWESIRSDIHGAESELLCHCDGDC